MTKLTSNRRYPTAPTVNDDPRSHTLALQAVLESLTIHERRTKDIDASFVRVEELIDVGLITMNGVTISLGDAVSEANVNANFMKRSLVMFLT